MKYILLACLVLGLAACACVRYQRPGADDVRGVSMVQNLFPTTVDEMVKRFDSTIKRAEDGLQKLLGVKSGERTFANTARAYDAIVADFSALSSVLHTIEMTHPDASLRSGARDLVIKMNNFSVEQLSHNKQVYLAFKDYEKARVANPEKLSAEEAYYLAELMKAFKHAGFELGDAEQERIKALQKELAELALTFEKNINEDNRSILVPEEELAGVDRAFVASLKRSDDGLVVVGVDYPTYNQVMENCVVEKTREALFVAFNNRAYPQNEPVLKRMIAARDELAAILGYQSFAHLDIDDSMAKTPQAVDQFLTDLQHKSTLKVAREVEEIKQGLPVGVSLVNDQFKPWDLAFVANEFKKKQYTLDEQEISHYFPLEKTLPALFKLYEDFFDVRFAWLPSSGLWHEEVQVLEVREKDGRLIGTLLLDLFPRPNKYTHACQISLLPSLRYGNFEQPGVAVVIANFPRKMASKPALLMRNDVSTFFHELGHALHSLFGATTLASVAGTNVKSDFVEMPSQMLEEWMTDHHILKDISSHVQTGASLPDDVIEKIIALKRFLSGNFVQRQALLSRFSLECFKHGGEKNPYRLKEQLQKALRPHVLWDARDHFEASFGHLASGLYASKYYGYMWSKVYALDLFAHIKKYGLRNPEIGKEYRAKILGRGGSAEPMTLIVDFLGREPNSMAFFSDLGLVEYNA